MFVNGSGRNEQSLQRTFHRCFLSSFSSFGQVVSEKIKIRKVNGRQMMDAKWWQKFTLPLARWANNHSLNHSIEIQDYHVYDVIMYILTFTWQVSRFNFTGSLLSCKNQIKCLSNASLLYGCSVFIGSQKLVQIWSYFGYLITILRSPILCYLVLLEKLKVLMNIQTTKFFCFFL